jgi:hypothetical protein
MILTTTTLIGLVGALIILGCFIANELNAFDRHSVWYNLGNIVGSLILIEYSYLLASWPFLILNIVWALVALGDLLKTLAVRSKNR